MASLGCSMVDVEQFIAEVKRRPVLWDPNHTDYNQRHSKLSAWEDVSANLYVDWGDLSNYDKFGRVRDIQNRWKNIRDSYIREVKYERKVQKGLAFPKKNKYKYSHLMEFLNAGEKGKVKGSDQSSTDIEESPEKKEEIKELNNFSGLKQALESSSPVDVFHENNQGKMNGSRKAKRFNQNNNRSSQFNLLSDSSTMDSDSNNQTANKDVKRAKQNSTSKEPTQPSNCPMEIERSKNQSYQNIEPSNQMFEDYFNSEPSHKVNAELLSPSVEIHSGFLSLPLDQDDDKMFLLSLLPYFKKLNEERKLQARIEMSTLLQKMIYKKS